MSNKVINAQLLKNQTIGCEIEMSKISKEVACTIVSKYFNDTYGIDSQAVYERRHLSNWVCAGRPDPVTGRARKWQFMDDHSASGDWGCITCEMVTPILRYEDIEDLQKIVRLLREAGAKSGAHYNAGVHIHIGADFDEDGGCNAKSIRNLVNLIASHEPLLWDAIKVTRSRYNWCRFVEPEFLRKINKNKPQTKQDLERAWYGYTGAHTHYDSTRYHLLNLHAIWDKGTIEFRCFEFHNNLHAGELKAWIQLCLAMVSYSKIIAYSSPKPIDLNDNPRYMMNSWLKNMGLIGDEFKTCRKMLLKHLSGDIAVKGGRAHVSNDLDDYAVDSMAE